MAANTNYAGKDVLDEVLAYAKGTAETPVNLRDPAATADCLLLGFVHRLTGAPEQAAPLLRAAVGHLRAPATPDGIRMSLPIFVSALAAWELVDDSATPDVTSMYTRFARRVGALMVLPAALTTQVGILLSQGRIDDAQEACTEGRALGEATGAPGAPDIASFMDLGLLCWRGHEEEARSLASKIDADVKHLEADTPRSYIYPWYFVAVLELSLGRYRQAYDYALPIFRDDRLGTGTRVLPDLIEAAARCDEPFVAQQALKRLEERAQASGAAWGLGRARPLPGAAGRGRR